MKPMLRLGLFILVFVVMQSSIHSQSVSINDDASLPHASAILDIKVSATTKKGVLIPRMTGVQRTAIVNPAKGLLVYDSTINSFWFHNGTSWQEIAKGANAWTVNGSNVYNLAGNIGIGTATPKAKLNVAQNRNVLFGASMSGLGEKLFWNGTKGAFRAGAISASYPDDVPPYAWDDVNIGYASFATGTDVTASGYAAAAFGQGTDAIGGASFASGIWTTGEGLMSAAFGFMTRAIGEGSFTTGSGNGAGGDYSASFNEDNASIGYGSFTAGYNNYSYGTFAATFGRRNFNTSYSGFVIGEFNDSITSKSHIIDPISPLFIIGNGSTTQRKNAFVVLRNGITGINKNPGSSAVNDGLLQLKQSGTRHLLTLEAATTTNKWSFLLNPSLALYYNNALRGTFNSTTGAYVAVSDSRLKKDINELSPVLSNVLQLKTYTYHLLDNDNQDPYSYGLMAQELEKVFPDMVTKVEPGKEGSLLGINYSNLGVIAIKAIQELHQVIDAQNKRIIALEKLMAEYIKSKQ